MPEKNLILTLALLLICIVLFVSRKVRPDFVAIMALAAISLSGVLTFHEALEGFSEPVIMMIALMFVISEGFYRTGISCRVGEWIYAKSGHSVSGAMVWLMLSVALLGSIMSTSAIMAIFLPITLNLCHRLKVSPSKLLMPVAFAGIISGMMTLVATTPNMIMSALLENSGSKPFGFFSITPLGLTVLAMGIAYMLYIHRFLGNSKEPETSAKARKNLADYIRDYRLKERGCILRVGGKSPLVGRTLRESNLRTIHSLNVICIERKNGKRSVLLNPSPDTNIMEGDILYADISTRRERIPSICAELKVETDSLHGKNLLDKSMQMGMAEISVLPESEYVGRTLSEIRLRNEFGLNAIGLRRNGKPLNGEISNAKLKVGDLVLVVGPQNLIKRLFSEDIGFAVIGMPAELSDMASAPDKAPYAILSMGVMIALMVFNIVPNALAALIACIMMVGFKCLSLESAYKSIRLQTVILIACMMPFATALEKSGAAKLAVDALFNICGGGGPHLVLTGLFALTMFVGLFMSNIVTTILIGPLAISTAAVLGVSPTPFAMAVAMGASTAFMSPLSTSVSLMVWEPGRYGFGDFLRVGLPFSIIVMAVCVVIIPILFPF